MTTLLTCRQRVARKRSRCYNYVMRVTYVDDTPIPLPRRLARRIDFSGDCWLWTSYVEATGYARVYINGGREFAHRFMWESVVGPIPDGMQIDHLCRVRHCVNPGHLRVVTPRVNTLASPVAPAAINARKTHCHNGHQFSADNTYLNLNGQRICRQCRREWEWRAYWNRKGRLEEPAEEI